MDLPRTVLQALHDQASRLGDRPALWAMHRRTWLPTSWRDHAKRVRQFALGLLGLSIAPGEPVAIMAFNGEAWIAAHLGAMATGAIPFGIYVSSTPARVEELLAHSRARAIVVEDARLARMVQGLRERLPKLEHIIVLDPSEGLPEGTHAFGDLVTRGAATREQLYWERVHALEPDGVATLVYQGREGSPRAVMLSHRNLLWTAAKLSASYELTEERLFSYLPLSHIAEQLMSVVGPLLMPSAQVYLSTGAAMLEQELEEAQPTVFFAPPRVWERFVHRIDARLQGALLPEARLFGWARRIATQFHTRKLAGAPVGLILEGQMELARQLVFSRLHAELGLDACRYLVSSTAPLPREHLGFLLSVDLPVRELYGRTESTGVISVSVEGATQLGRLGRPMLGVELRVAGDGELLVRGENVCLGYYREPKATKALLRDGWLHTGDRGELDREGYLRMLVQQPGSFDLDAAPSDDAAQSG